MTTVERGKGDESMTNVLSNWAREFLREDRVAVVSTLNKDGSSHVTTIWYLLADDGTLVITTPGRSQKSKNLRRDPRIALCVGDVGRSVSLYGRVSIIEDQTRVRQDLERVIERYVKDEDIRPQVVTTLLQRAPVALHFLPEKVTEFSALNAGSILSQ
jgi:PPOX class probable F420-dependent enzyme